MKVPDVLSEFCALRIPPNDLAGFFARRIGGQHEEPWARHPPLAVQKPWASIPNSGKLLR
jgi:hypothetical protein